MSAVHEDARRLSGERILISGATGKIARPLVERLAADNEVWAIARFSGDSERRALEAVGVTTRKVDLNAPDLSAIPNDFSYLLHLAARISDDMDYPTAMRTNAESTGALLHHCRDARAALVMSTCSVYRPNPDPYHPYAEGDPLGDSAIPYAPTYAVTKIAQEAVAKAVARIDGIPVVIARMDTAYGPNGGLPASHLQLMRAGRPVVVRRDPLPYTPINWGDIDRQLEPLLSAATVDGTVVNWCGDEVVTAQEWCAFLGELTNVTPEIVVHDVPGSQPGVIADNTLRTSITGACTVSWRDGMREMVEAIPAP